jgi:alkylation response protein AidB-like acyl-CoA dehydrogenase
MNFDLNDDQREIKDTARKFLSDRFKPEKVRELAESRSYDDALTKEIAELGWPGIAIAEENGGQGLGMVELASICEEIGYACAPLPYLPSIGAALFIETLGSDEQKSEWLPKLASGEATGTFGSASADSSGLFGDLPSADVVAIFGEDGARLASADQLEIERFESIDATRAFGKIGGIAGDEVAGDASAAGERISVAIAAELTGVAQRAMEMAVDYARERQQFGRPIGAYQAVSHRCASMLLATEESRSLTYYAAWCADAQPESLPLAAAMAHARAADAAWEVANASLQVHGGIGFTWEHDLQFWLKRARVAGGLLGSARESRDRVAELAGLGASEPAAVA